MFKRVINSPGFIWALLALPSLPMMGMLLSGDAHEVLHPSGEFAARFMIIAMILTPMRMLFPKSKFWLWMMRRRRYLGVAAFGYALLHTLGYIVDMGNLRAMLGEFFELGIWSGWLAFAIFLPLAITSNDRSVRALGKRWKQLQRWVYPAAVAALVHWIFIENQIGPALVHFLPLAGLELWRIWQLRHQRLMAPPLGA